MIFKRVLHPVGQGAFFTEQFYDENDVNIFTVAYDCGEKNSNKHLEREIDNTLYPTGQPVEIDLMFISHLDEDHISGIEYLVKKKELDKSQCGDTSTTLSAGCETHASTT